MASIADMIRELRKRRGLSMRDLSPLIGLSPTTISQFENGKVDTPTRQLVDWAGALGAEVVILDRSDDERTAMAAAAHELGDEDLALVLNLIRTLPKMSARDRAGLAAELAIIQKF